MNTFAALCVLAATLATLIGDPETVLTRF